MSQHQRSFLALREEFYEAVLCRRLEHPARYKHWTKRINEILDQFNDFELRATEWDAHQWGLLDDLPLLKAVRQFGSIHRKSPLYPQEPVHRLIEVSI